ncbi:hypothetical protein FRAAL0208 [Frankia alni ACN14a]|uniref:Uncharacterized protein n=1 Tax=Frankia alni (strain DSM 45986 / CECT 9034 / ACN14a) TaxID=326424 RepID=Q0RU58_FRAAA|nr:hypothetical protein FRAAL0208 [Frankia alni ACN14a]
MPPALPHIPRSPEGQRRAIVPPLCGNRYGSSQGEADSPTPETRRRLAADHGRAGLR